jgi:hypothetical protein
MMFHLNLSNEPFVKSLVVSSFKPSIEKVFVNVVKDDNPENSYGEK